MTEFADDDLNAEDVTTQNANNAAVDVKPTAVQPAAVQLADVHVANQPAAVQPVAAAAVVNNADEDDAQMQLQLVQLRLKHEMLRLQREIAAMEEGAHAAPPVAAQAVRRQVRFGEIKNAIVKFSGEDWALGVLDFLRHLEQILDHVNADETLRYLVLRNSLTGAARLLLKRGELTYDGLKGRLIAEFGRAVSRREIYQALANRRMKSGESVRRYVMEMEAIARRSDVEDADLVAFVRDGLASRTASEPLFMMANNMADVKRAIDRFEQRQAMREVADEVRQSNRMQPKPMRR